MKPFYIHLLKKMKIIIDADACPMVDIAVDTAVKRELECIIVCDNTHSIQKDGAVTAIVDKGTDSADCSAECQHKILRRNKNGHGRLSCSERKLCLSMV